MSAGKRLTPPQSRKVNALVKRECCNCIGGNCILLDDGEECLPAAHFLFAALQVVPYGGASRRHALIGGADEHRGQEALYRVRRVLCVQFK